MASVLLCEAEKTYILHGVEDNFRSDGRQRDDYRPMELETGFVPHTMGSARLRLANTDVVVGVKTEIDTPTPEDPYSGRIEFFVDCSANATPAFEGRGGENLATEISNSLYAAYKSSTTFNLASLCIIPSRLCWKIYVDILILECGGNLFDAVSVAVKAALHETRVPAVRAAVLDGGDVELDLSDDPHECRRLNVTNIPVMVTVCRVGDACVVDPSAVEEACSGASLVLAVNKGRVGCVLKQGAASLHPSTLTESFKLGCAAASALDTALSSALAAEAAIQDKPHVGFLGR